MINQNRNTMVLAGILLMLGFFALAEGGSGIILILLGLLFALNRVDNRNLNSQRERLPNYEDEFEDLWETADERRPAQSEPVYRHALEAVSRAGLDPDNVQVLAVDIGVLAFASNNEPAVFRTWTLPDDVDYIQPFVQLRLPTKASGRIRFELLDSAGAPVYIHEDVHNLERGRNFITPSTRLPIHDQREFDGKWRLRVTADGVVLALHEFSFAEAHGEAIGRHIGEDGEINTELRAVMAENRLPKMSLDDLLSYQEDEEAQSRSS